MLGFETMRNATITIFDNSPALTSDPWINGNPYFGSWSHPYEIPKKQLEKYKSLYFLARSIKRKF